MTIVRPETVMRWQRAGFRRYWRWKSRKVGGRPKIAADLRALIRQMSIENGLWGAPRIHGELLKLGFAVAQSTVAARSCEDADLDQQAIDTTTPMGRLVFQLTGAVCRVRADDDPPTHQSRPQAHHAQGVNSADRRSTARPSGRCGSSLRGALVS